MNHHTSIKESFKKLAILISNFSKTKIKVLNVRRAKGTLKGCHYKCGAGHCFIVEKYNTYDCQ